MAEPIALPLQVIALARAVVAVLAGPSALLVIALAMAAISEPPENRPWHAQKMAVSIAVRAMRLALGVGNQGTRDGSTISSSNQTNPSPFLRILPRNRRRPPAAAYQILPQSNCALALETWID